VYSDAEVHGEGEAAPCEGGPTNEINKSCAETVERAAGALEGVDDVERGDGFALSVLGVGDRVADDVLEEDLEHAARLLVDEARDTLYTTTAGETTDGGLGDTLDVVAKNLAVALSSALAESLATFATARHVVGLGIGGWR